MLLEGERAMRTIQYKKQHSLKHRRKVISINEHNEDKDCQTYVHKSFVYVVTQAAQVGDPLQDPQIFIRKQLDSKTNEEHFSFKVKGAFYMTRDRGFFKVDFCHALRIRIVWKNKIFSPKKSVTLA